MSEEKREPYKSLGANSGDRRDFYERLESTLVDLNELFKYVVVINPE